MPTNEQHPEQGTEYAVGRRGPNFYAAFGPLVVFAGAVTYFVFFARFPALRDFPWINLPIVVLGFLMSAVGLQRSLSHPNRTSLSLVMGSVTFLLSSALAALFCVYIFYLSFQLPETSRVVQVSQVAPGFELLDQDGRTVKLSDFRGKKVIVDFYRGHW